jgi:hypothetical protein
MEERMTDTHTVEIYEENEEPPSTEELSVKMGRDGDNRYRFSIAYLTTFFLCRNVIRPKWILSEILDSNGSDYTL